MKVYERSRHTAGSCTVCMLRGESEDILLITGENPGFTGRDTGDGFAAPTASTRSRAARPARRIRPPARHPNDKAIRISSPRERTNEASPPSRRPQTRPRGLTKPTGTTPRVKNLNVPSIPSPPLPYKRETASLAELTPSSMGEGRIYPQKRLLYACTPLRHTVREQSHKRKTTR